jgi:hypothetical protein
MKTNLLSRFFLAAVLAVALIPFGHAQDRDRDRDRGHDWERARGIISRSMDDLRHIERRDAFARDDRERYDHALRALSEVDRSFADGRYDRGRLDEAIEQLDHITRSRVLDPRERDRVLDDLRDLRRLREDWR